MRPARKRETGKAEARHPVGANGAEARRGFVACENELGGRRRDRRKAIRFRSHTRRRVIHERFFFPSRSQFGKIGVADENRCEQVSPRSRSVTRGAHAFNDS